jgi:hypothetical protein
MREIENIYGRYKMFGLARRRFMKCGPDEAQKRIPKTDLPNPVRMNRYFSGVLIKKQGRLPHSGYIAISIEAGGIVSGDK